MTFEIILAIAFIVGILGFNVALVLFLFILWPRFERHQMRKRFPIVVPGTPGMRMNASPVPGITPEEVGRGWKLFRARCVEKGYDGKALDKEFSYEFIELVRGTDGERYIVDQWGRKIAGDRSGDVCRVVVIEDDSWGTVAGFHEWGHGAHATKGKVDYPHRDDIMWHDIVAWCRKEFSKA